MAIGDRTKWRPAIPKRDICFDDKVLSNEYYYCGSGTEIAYANLTVEGRYLNKGVVVIFGSLNLQGEFDNLGTLEVW